MSEVQAIGLDALATTTHYIVIDKSDTTNFPHTKVGPITLLSASGYVLGLTSANVAVKIGCITYIDDDNSIIKWIAAEAAIAADERVQFKDLFPDFPITPELAHLSAGGAGSTLYDATNTDFDTGETHKTPYDATGSTVVSAVGDIVMSVTVTAGTVDIRLWLEYDI